MKINSLKYLGCKCNPLTMVLDNQSVILNEGRQLIDFFFFVTRKFANLNFEKSFG